MKPKRIQRKRTKGWRKPLGAVCVTRPGKFGNPFETARLFEFWLERFVSGKAKPIVTTDKVRHMKRIAESLEELRGKDLACYCKVGESCHADVLIEFANR